MHSAFLPISTRAARAGAPSLGNPLIRLPLSRDGQGKIIGEKIEHQFGRAIVRSEFGYEIVGHKNQTWHGGKSQEGVRQKVATQWLAEKRQWSII